MLKFKPVSELWTMARKDAAQSKLSVDQYRKQIGKQSQVYSDEYYIYVGLYQLKNKIQ